MLTFNERTRPTTGSCWRSWGSCSRTAPRRSSDAGSGPDAPLAAEEVADRRQERDVGLRHARLCELHEPRDEALARPRRRDREEDAEKSWFELDTSGKTGLVLTLDDAEAFEGPVTEQLSSFGGSTSLYIPIIRGQLGDSLRQLGWALFYAEQNNFTTVDVTHQAYSKHFSGFLKVREDPVRADKWGKLRVIDMQPKPAGYIPSSRCSVGTTKFDPKDSRPSFQCGGMEPQEWARILKTYIKPNLMDNVLTDSHQTPGELIIHMRSGDAMTSTDPLAKMEVQLPPCAFYDLVVEEGNEGKPFRNVRIITQDDDLNPCVEEVQKRHPDVNLTVQRGSLNEDASAIMNAYNVVLAPSFFSFFMVLMNEGVASVTYAESDTILDHFPEGVMPCGALGDPQVTVLKVPQLSDLRWTLQERQTWMRSYDRSLIRLASRC